MPSLLTWGDREEFRVPLTITQTISIGEPDITPLSTAHLLCHFAMSDSMRWNESLKKPGRPAGVRTWNVADNSLKHKSIPKEHAKNFMSSNQRRELRRAIINRANFLQKCWRPTDLILPALEIPSNTKEDSSSMLQLYRHLWDWQDECVDTMRQFREETQATFDFSSFEVAFSGVSRLESLRGGYYNTCVAALAERMRELDVGANLA
jgi:hypothetical protein